MLIVSIDFENYYIEIGAYINDKLNKLANIIGTHLFEFLWEIFTNL